MNVVVEFPASVRWLTGGGGLRSGSGDALLAGDVTFVGVTRAEIGGSSAELGVSVGGVPELEATTWGEVITAGWPGVVVGQK